MRRKVSGLVGWTIQYIRHTDGNLLAIKLRKGEGAEVRYRWIQVASEWVYDADGNHLENNAVYVPKRDLGRNRRTRLGHQKGITK